MLAARVRHHTRSAKISNWGVPGLLHGGSGVSVQEGGVLCRRAQWLWSRERTVIYVHMQHEFSRLAEGVVALVVLHGMVPGGKAAVWHLCTSTS